MKHDRLSYANTLCLVFTIFIAVCILLEVSILTKILLGMYLAAALNMSDLTQSLIIEIPRWCYYLLFSLVSIILIGKEYALKSINDKLFANCIFLTAMIFIFIFYLYFLMLPLVSDYYFFKNVTF